MRYPLHHREKHLLIQRAESICRTITKENLASRYCSFVIFAAVYEYRKLLGKTSLQGAEVCSRSLLCYEIFDLFFSQESENLDVTGGIFVTHIQPKLVESVGRSVTTVEPNIPLLGLAKLTSVCLGNEGACKGVSLASFDTAN